MIDLDPARGHEQAGHRPALVVSDDVFNSGPAGLVIVLPVTSKPKGVRTHVAVQPPEGGLRKPSFIKCEDVRSVAVERLGKRLGVASLATMEAVAMRLRILMDL
ncbi:MAG: type II toxin-antitoxin system PemK/MazF family toxin [Pirellulales bacterium]|nr:type II toxin-antitoxin system PemK/MazF family toxin [Pirellulales bacterium]